MMHIKRLTYLFALAFATLLTFNACRDELYLPKPDYSEGRVSYNEDGTMNVVLGMELPEMTLASTRALGEDDYANLQGLSIYMLVFEEGEGLRQFARLSDKDEPTTDDRQEHDNRLLVKFRATLEPTEKNVVIHLIATDQPNFSQQVSNGMEERVIPSLYTDENHSAYWQRIDPECNIPSKEQADETSANEKFNEVDKDKAQKITTMLNHVPMIRNFCKVSIGFSDKFSSNSGADSGNYKITELYVINTVDRGTVAPYLASYTEDDGFIDFYTETGGRFEPLDYRTITDTKKYVGSMPAGVALINKIDNPENIVTKSIKENPDPVYFYERPARTNSTERTYAIVCITNNGVKNYYKIDIGHVWDPYTTYPYMGVFEYYNLLRNFNYQILINRIEGDGYSTIEEAARGPVFNNISASVEARTMKSISDGDDWIYVSRTSYVFTKKNEELILKAQYRTNIGNEAQTKVENDLINYTIGKPEIVFNQVEEVKNTANDINSYNTYTIVCNQEPTNELQRQDLYIYRGNKSTDLSNPDYGLYRIITLYMHQPWEFLHIDTYPGLWNDFDDVPWDWSNEKREIGQSAGSPLTLFFELPPDLPQAIFPLEFTIESDRQNIQNAYQGNAVVRSVPADDSLFKDDTNKPSTSRIQYVKTVTWEEYHGTWDEESPESGSNGGGKNTIVRCRFLTITDLAQDGVGSKPGNNQNSSESESDTRLRVYNEYFGSLKGTVWREYAEDSFHRTTTTSDPSPRFWDFSSGIWDNVMNTMNESGRTTLSESNSLVDELYFDETTSRDNNQSDYVLMSNSIDETTGMRYVLTGHKNNRFVHHHDYPASQQRKMRIEVMSTDNDGNPTPPRIALANIFYGATQNDNGIADPTTYTMDETGKFYIYDVTIPSDVTKLDVRIYPNPDYPVMRFYKINFYPRWDTMITE